LAILAIGLTPVGAHADDTQLWTTMLFQGGITPGSRNVPMLWLETQLRFGNDVSNLNQSIVRPGFGIRFAPDFHAIAGYQVERNTPKTGASTTEHRMWQQLMLPIHRDPERLILLARFRLEQRHFEHAQDLGWRLRTMVRAQVPLNGRGSAGPLLWSEAFIGLNDTDWGQREGLRQLRIFGGGLVPLNKRLNLEAGYMARVLINPGADRTDHVASITLNYRLGD
jgi:hypothetical protein